MTKTELYTIIADNGWTIKKGVDDTAYKVFVDRQVQIIPGVKNLVDKYRIYMMPSVSTDVFSKAVEYIGENKKSKKRWVYYGIVNLEEKVTIVDFLDRAFVESYLERIETWAQQVDIAAGLQNYCELPTNSAGNLPLRHLTALAVTGQVEKLNEYLESFKQGDRLGFVPYIKQDYIERALEIAKESS